MFKPKREGRFGGKPAGKKFGDKPSWKRDDRGGSSGSRGYHRDGDMGSSMAHDATCADCGKACKVPFKPNGKKPVYCINCFKKEGNAPATAAGRDSRSFGAPREMSADPGAGARVLEAQLKAINTKLDAIMEALND